MGVKLITYVAKTDTYAYGGDSSLRPGISGRRESWKKRDKGMFIAGFALW